MSQTPAASSAETPSVFQRVTQVINRIRPAVQSDGGDVELVEVTADGVARIRLHGSCVGCPSSSMTSPSSCSGRTGSAGTSPGKTPCQ